jgi:uncharacterized membrane protein YdjX (TVP38/TMEM64 family)
LSTTFETTLQVKKNGKCTILGDMSGFANITLSSIIMLFFYRTLALKETSNSIKKPKKNENYNEILKNPFIFIHISIRNLI